MEYNQPGMKPKVPYHPDYLANKDDWVKWRLVYEAGQKFVDAYLENYWNHESQETFRRRVATTYIPSFASSAIDEVKNGIIHRLPDVNREGGNKTYQEAKHNFFMATETLPELLPIGKIGVFVDRADLDPDVSLYEAIQTSPYIYTYKAEEILNWEYDEVGLRAVLLQHSVYERDELTQLPIGLSHEYRFYERQNRRVTLKIYNSNFEEQSTKELTLTIIPIHIEELPNSLMKNIAGHQIAMLNMGSNNVYYSLIAGFPFYIEQSSGIGEEDWSRPTVDNQVTDPPVGDNYGIRRPGESGYKTVGGGPGGGRKYPKNADAPQFISPPTDPLIANMQLYEKLKAEIRTLINVGLATLNIQGNIKMEGEETEEAGLSAIARSLESLENGVAVIWAEYEGTKPAIVTYPTDFSLRSLQERIEEAKSLQETIDSVPSLLAKKALSKEAVSKILYSLLPRDKIKAIYKEIDNAVAVIGDRKVLNSDFEAGYVDSETASKIACYPEGCVEKAKKEREERLKAIAESQTIGPARGLPDGNPAEAKAEKKESQSADKQPDGIKAVRGEGK